MKNRIVQIFLITSLFALALCVNAQTDKDSNKRNKQKDAAINSNKKTPVKYIEYIVGTWEVQGVYKDNKDISKTDTVGQENELMEFNRDGKYTSYSGTEKIDSGLYRLNEEHATLYLESQSEGNRSKGVPIEWTVTFNKNEMILQNKQTSARAERLKYVYSRKSTKPLH